MAEMINPFSNLESDRHAIWEMLVRRDITAFANNNWPLHEADFLSENFLGIDGQFSSNPDSWSANFPNLETYAASWQAAAASSQGRLPPDQLIAAHYKATTLRDIDIQGDFAIAHKKFDGRVEYSDGEIDLLNWQTLYVCRKHKERWWISGFIGMLPNPMGANSKNPVPEPKQAPQSKQHITAGPYSPVLTVCPGKIVVISGQAAIDLEGNLVSNDFSTQSRITLDNCRAQLKAAGCDFRDVFKANVFLTDLGQWSNFNEIYKEVMPEPRPVRTAIQTGLLEGLQVEIEMWAVKS